MLTKNDIQTAFSQLNDRLRQEGQRGEVGIVEGAVMCLVYNARAATKDVDAIFEPVQVIRNAAKSIARDLNLPEDWLNDAAKGFLREGFKRETVANLSHLLVWAPEPRYMLAMKCLSARWDTSDRDDVIFLIRHLAMKSKEEVFELIAHYYPQSAIPAKTKFFIEEAMEREGNTPSR